MPFQTPPRTPSNGRSIFPTPRAVPPSSETKKYTLSTGKPRYSSGSASSKAARPLNTPVSASSALTFRNKGNSTTSCSSLRTRVSDAALTPSVLNKRRTPSHPITNHTSASKLAEKRNSAGTSLQSSSNARTASSSKRSRAQTSVSSSRLRPPSNPSSAPTTPKTGVRRSGLGPNNVSPTFGGPVTPAPLLDPDEDSTSAVTVAVRVRPLSAK